jgi:hypothetical protein
MRRTFGGAKVRPNGAKYAVLRSLYASFAAAARYAVGHARTKSFAMTC